MTEKQKQNYNKMVFALDRIKRYDSPSKLRRTSNKNWGIDYEEALEMAYENIQDEAKIALKGIKPIN